jgi:V8-like Glu-specific endopeptidase
LLAVAVLLAAGVSTGAAADGGASAATSVAAPGPERVAHWTAPGDTAQLGRYWTAHRLAAASPATVPASRRAAAPTAPGKPSAGTTLARPAAPTSTHFTGVADVGTIAYTSGGQDHRATASVVTSPRRNLIVTAAHVLLGARDVVFIPKYHDGAKPFGDWLVDKVYIDSRYVKSHDADLDFALATIRVRNGRTLQSVTGANGLVTSRGFVNRVRVIGYPAAKYQPAGRDEPVHCSNTTRRFRTYRYQVEFDCAGFPNGTSGSPWILRYDSHTGLGYTNGVIGGYDQGGPSSSVSTTSYFDDDIKQLYATARG